MEQQENPPTLSYEEHKRIIRIAVEEAKRKNTSNGRSRVKFDK